MSPSPNILIGVFILFINPLSNKDFESITDSAGKSLRAPTFTIEYFFLKIFDKLLKGQL